MQQTFFKFSPVRYQKNQKKEFNFNSEKQRTKTPVKTINVKFNKKEAPVKRNPFFNPYASPDATKANDFDKCEIISESITYI